MQASKANDFLNIAKNVAKKAAIQLFKNTVELRKVHCDLPRDVKVKADQFLDDFIRDQLSQRTDIPIISEESFESQIFCDGYQWIVDPLDGSLNFSLGIPICCISIALWDGFEPILGVIYDFNRDEIFEGIVGMEGRLNGKPIKPGIIQGKSKAVLVTGFPVKTDFSNEALLNFVENIKYYKKIRLLGSAALSLAYVACGRADIYHENDIKLWDVAAGLAIVNSVGGKIKISSLTDDLTLNVQASNSFLLP
jgi:myo-inositol-1(or 4)-monophosphatase